MKVESEFHQKMDGQTKLTRTNSSLLRSSPTIRSSIHSLSSVSEIAPDSDAEDLEEQKPHSRPLPPPFRSGAAPVAAASLLLLYALFAFLTSDDLATSENLLSALIFVAVLLFLLSRNKGFVSRNVNLLKQICDEYGKRLGFVPRNQSKPVQWFIGEAESEELESRKIVREGVEFYSNGDFYEGEFHKGTCNGSGVYNYFVNGRYEGDWIDGKYDGYGIESWARGSRYRGQYRQGLRHGFGVYKFYTGDSYAGEWCNGQSHGVGAQTCGDGSCFVGEFKCGVKHGLGCYHFRNGDRYAGEYFGDKIHGFGVYHFANGHFYQGSWHEGRKQGFGMYTFRNGDARCGEWDNGSLSIPLTPLTDAVLRAVQAARKTAENAIHLRRVDEQVNKAVVAANRASTAARVAAIKAVQNRIHGQFCDTNL
ncbi:phosphatidylinositol 4-phosphate 5-kinase 1-like [Salvia hispanica]|uniref:phosphatidylinositol 4-phosphate 5-kinase 1-like n=1 Tax=Salvia hispanica TaxID=49212 RepID=UPI00200983F1|nr:phosphatidylinositol 4-phosphate 5-kinase 1-like [Salvia hispanica]XP_047977068.1 phosphatidylinositol 4-phosphate 5-kinase 1-like [Salvia hispanica]